ncbi:MAG TPA: hypothetical protein VG889_13850 [Rhizomicrobium sp.]|nr:hypothetical protein [Rhizomicrobium sp.]
MQSVQQLQQLQFPKELRRLCQLRQPRQYLILNNRFLPGNWVENVIGRSNGRRAVTHVSDLVRNPEELRGIVCAVLASAAGIKARPPFFRVFVDSAQRFDLADSLFGTEPGLFQDPQRRLPSVLGSDRFCLTLNGLTAWNEEFHRLMQAEIVSPLVSTDGILPTAFDFYTFMSTSGFTPFGIHDDRGDALLFHLGPGAKDVWLWSRARYLALVGGGWASFDFERMCASGRHIRLEPGDALFIPAGEFHLLRSADFNMFLGVIIGRQTCASRIKEAVDLFAELHGDERLRGALEPASEAGLGIRRYAAMQELVLASNGYVSQPPHMMDDRQCSPREDLFALSCHSVGCKRLADAEVLFSRGRVFKTSPNRAIESVVELVNAGAPFDFDRAGRCAEGAMPLDQLEAMLRFLVRSRGIAVVPASAAPSNARP